MSCKAGLLFCYFGYQYSNLHHATKAGSCFGQNIRALPMADKARMDWCSGQNSECVNIHRILGTARWRLAEDAAGQTPKADVSCHLDLVESKSALLRLFYTKKSFARFLDSPLSQKVTLGSSVQL